MDETAIKNYLAADYAKAVKFYDDRANASKRWYRGLSIYVLAVSAGLTALIAFAPENSLSWRIISAAVSATIVLATGLLAHLKCHENWLSYRGSWDALERERRFYQTVTGAYKSATDRGALFVERVEAILTKEGTDFYARHAKGDEQAKNRAR
jgi:hypothetical protein